MMAVQLKHVALFINLNTYRCARLYSFVLMYKVASVAVGDQIWGFTLA
jgi:hypothetical protein